MKNRIYMAAIIGLLSVFSVLGKAKSSYAYYGGMGLGGLYGLGGLSGGMGLYGGMYGMMGGMYGMGGLGGMYGMGGLGGMYGMGGLGGMYGMGGLGGMYGMMGGLYGMGGLGGMYGMMGGMYGMGGLGGMYGMGGLGGMYGMMGGLYGMGGLGGMYGMMGGLYGMGGLGSMLGLGLMGGLGNTISASQPAVTAAPSLAPTGIVAEQAGYWSGYWLSYLKLKGGPMTLNIVEDPLTGALTATAALLLNQFKIPPMQVTGIDTGTGSFTLSGTFFDPINLITYVLQLNCVLTTDTTMTGDFYITDQLYTKVDYGVFDLTLGAAAPLLLPTLTTLPII